MFQYNVIIVFPFWAWKIQIKYFFAYILELFVSILNPK